MELTYIFFFPYIRHYFYRGQFVLADPVWQRVFELAGVVSRGESGNMLGKIWPNTGVLVFNINPTSNDRLEQFKSFLDAWIALTDKTFYWLNGLKQDIYFTETLSFLLALIEANVAYELLPIQMNCQLNMPLLDFQRNGYIDTLMYDEVPIVVHYPLETIPFNKYGYVGALTPYEALRKAFPFIGDNRIPLNHINQFYLQQGGTPFFHGSPTGIDFVQDVLINPVVGPYCNPLLTKRYGLSWNNNNEDDSLDTIEYDDRNDFTNIPSRKSFLSLLNGYVNTENYKTLLQDLALYCQSPTVFIDFYDRSSNNTRKMIQTKEDLTFAMEQLMYYHLNEDDGTIDDTMVLNLFVTGPQYDL